MMSLVQLVAELIDRSVLQNEIVHVRTDDVGRALGHGKPEGVAVVCEALMLECEDHVENGSVHEYWGTDNEGNEWRVHVDLSSEETES